VAIIIVNYNAGELLAGNLQRIIDSAGEGIQLHLFIVDNQSTDNSFDLLTQKINTAQLASIVTLIQAEKNGGFAYGNNVGMKAALASGFKLDYFYLLNPDAYPEADCFKSIINFSVSQDDSCIVGSAVVDESGEFAASRFVFPWIASELYRGASLNLILRLFPKAQVALKTADHTVQCDWVSGAGFLIPKNVFMTLGPMDQEYFLYYEEVDYMFNAKQNSIKVFQCPESKVVHIGGFSTGLVNNRSVQKIPAYWYQSWHRFFKKNYGKSYMFAAGLAWIAGRVINNSLSIIVPRRRIDDGHRISSFIKYAMMGK